MKYFNKIKNNENIKRKIDIILIDFFKIYYQPIN